MQKMKQIFEFPPPAHCMVPDFWFHEGRTVVGSRCRWCGEREENGHENPKLLEPCKGTAPELE